MKFNEFLQLVRTLRMLYGVAIAQKVFEKNIGLYYDLDSASIISSKKVETIH